MEGVLSEVFLSQGVLSGGGFVRISHPYTLYKHTPIYTVIRVSSRYSYFTL